jgi:hypothetical protein
MIGILSKKDAEKEFDGRPASRLVDSRYRKVVNFFGDQVAAP